MAARRARQLWQSFTRVLGTLFLLSLFGTALGSLGMYTALHHTAKPEFCITCHNMQPYYDSWLSSSHADVSCIECHYEPGAIETIHGKFEALSQLSKYLTRTQGTKPWAEVSDASCMRSGCHSVRMLEGNVEFKGVRFDHRQHLLESRRGRRLRCVTCHSQIVQGDHLSVTTSVCFMCHFMPDAEGSIPESTGGCLICHGPPEQPVLVEGRAFEHAAYVSRGVDCRDCHDPVVEGAGLVRRERCHSCHGEVGHIERIGETAFLHEMHVTDHKVECFECHDDIHHGLLDLPEPKPAATEGCGSCHESSHDAALKLYSGRGAVGVDEQPSRMYQTRVVCRACHTGRSGRRATGPLVRDAHGADPRGADPHGSNLLAAHTEFGGGSVASAGDIDCMHCHGTEFNGMLERWQASVSDALARVQPELATLGKQLEERADHPAWTLYDEARRNVELVRLDGSRGVHNPTYALDALRASAERIDRARLLLGDETADSLAAGFRPATSLGCDDCHADIGMREVGRESANAFPHRSHLLEAGLDCDTCHGVGDAHGATVERTSCAACHHGAGDERDLSDCSDCHATQASFLHGALAGLDEAHPSVMAEMDCTECHGEPPDLMRPTPQLCVLCHEEGYDALHHEWQAAVDEQLVRLQPLLGQLRAALPADPEHPARSAYEEALARVEAVARDGSLGIHNVGGTMNELRASAARIDEARKLLELDELERANVGFPFRSAHGCQECHAGIGRPETVTHAEDVFPHRKHLYGASMDCDTCHSVVPEEHGQPSFARDRCVDCHHQESPDRELPACRTCHDGQVRMLDGTLPGFDPMPGTMAELECGQCHGLSPDIEAHPNPRLCVLCHERGYDALQGQWQGEVEALVARLDDALGAARSSGDVTPDRLDRARRAAKAVRADGSRGIHNYELTKKLLEDALRELEED